MNYMDFTFNYQEFNKYRVDLPYPVVRIHEKNPHYAALVSGIFAGKGSEMTAVTQYTTHSFYNEDYPEIFSAYKYISAVEYTHLVILGNLLKEFGGVTLFKSDESNEYWNGDFPAYRFSVKQILQSDIEGEKGAIAHYTRLIGEIALPLVQSLFKRIIMDEERHLEILTAFYDSL